LVVALSVKVGTLLLFAATVQVISEFKYDIPLVTTIWLTSVFKVIALEVKDKDEVLVVLNSKSSRYVGVTVAGTPSFQ